LSAILQQVQNERDEEFYIAGKKHLSSRISSKNKIQSSTEFIGV